MDSSSQTVAAAFHQMTPEVLTVMLSITVTLLILFFPRGGLVWGLDLRHANLPPLIDRTAALRAW